MILILNFTRPHAITYTKKDGDKIQHGGSTVWQEEVNKKLDSLLRLIPLVEDLKEDLKKLKEENESLRTSLTWATEEINDLRKHQANTEEELKVMKEQVINANQELDLLQRRSIKLEAQSRRNNIEVFNVKETETMDSFKETESVLKKLLVDQLKMPKEEVADLEFERVHDHRIPTRRSDENDSKKATVRATCVGTKLRDKLQEKFPSVTAPLVDNNYKRKKEGSR